MHLIGQMGALFSARTLAPILRMFVVIGIARGLGVEALGNYQIVMAQYAIFESLISLGLWSFTIREIAADRSRAGTILLHGSLLSLLVTFPAALGMHLVGLSYADDVRLALLVMCFALWPAGVSSYSDGVLIAFERTSYVAVLMLCEELFLTAAACFCLWLGYGLLAVIAVAATARVVGASVRASVAVRIARPIEWRFRRDVVLLLCRHAPVFLSTALLWTLFWRTDTLMLSWLSTPANVGLYSAALRIVSMFQELPKAVLVTIFPRLSALHQSSQASFRQLSIRTGGYLLLFSMIASLGVSTFGRSVLTALFSDKFAQASPVLEIMIWSLVPFSVANLLGNMLIASRNQNADLVINAIALILNVVLNLVLIPPYGVLGAVAANILSVSGSVVLRAGFLWANGMSVPRVRSIAVERAG